MTGLVVMGAGGSGGAGHWSVLPAPWIPSLPVSLPASRAGGLPSKALCCVKQVLRGHSKIPECERRKERQRGSSAAGRRLICDPLATVRHSVMCLLYGLPSYTFYLPHYQCPHASPTTGRTKDPITPSCNDMPRTEEGNETYKVFRKATHRPLPPLLTLVGLDIKFLPQRVSARCTCGRLRAKYSRESPRVLQGEVGAVTCGTWLWMTGFRVCIQFYLAQYPQKFLRLS